MTIELLDLPDLPENLGAQALTMVAVQSSSGPQRYKAPIAQVTGSYVNKVSGGTAGNPAVLTEDGEIADGGAPGAAVETTALGTLSDIGSFAAADQLYVERTTNGTTNSYSGTPAELATYVRSTPAGDRSVALASGSAVVALLASDNNRIVVVTGSVAGSVTLDGAAPGGFACLLLNESSAALSYTGFTGNDGSTSLAAGGAANIVRGGGATKALVPLASSGGAAAVAATGISFTQSATSVATGAADTLTIAPTGGIWPPGTLTLTESGDTGAFGAVAGGAMSGNTITPAFGAGSVTVAWTGSAAGTATFTLTNTMGISNPAALSLTVTSAGGGGGSGGPSLTLTGATFDTASPRFGAASLSGGSGTATLANSTAASGFTVEMFVRAVSGGSVANPFLSITDGTNTMGIATAYNAAVAYANGSSNGYTNQPDIEDGEWHHLCLQFPIGSGCKVHLDGNQSDYFGSQAFTGAASITLHFATGTTITGIDSLRVSTGQVYGDPNFTPPSAVLTRTASTLGLWQFDAQNGTGA